MPSAEIFTIAVDSDLLNRAKVIAAKCEISIDEFLNSELRYLLESVEAAESTGNHNFKTLLDFSLGRIEEQSAINLLGILGQEDLFLLMAQSHLPMPRLPKKTIQKMVSSLHEISL